MSNLDQLVELLNKNNFKTRGFEQLLKEDYAPAGPAGSAANFEHAFDVIVENQRGVKLLGIPLFSGKSLLPLMDPPMYQRLDGVKVTLAHEAMANYPLPGVDWHWSWALWYVLMLYDVDESGWLYLTFWRPTSSWHGRYHVSDFVRRRLWVRRRHRDRQPGS
ncbi:hypothetical protein METBIDRAFT_41268 [Metschnikowia bicuspidata var. bicuspidata NRRL YB-4993]|uniref:Peroxin/Ferlin domain-containing protein n=1 Tax=Metschnikowia bicuspidata var. bicuspidata NRRL YB-4993 TaxID=869754 RepID=A0A1A0HA54_9ASCO|nr:hypothetical protein METBIDRAFT_41268 [Metschnikowia bicuspidata var. bicuspidata NRRL YB-4993]OBA21009.1 hypothetical protein METBIDRAFT_41268 [Metschnikowia bicuspidata var. bicuspidata NRRL YB-4993]